MRPPLIAGAPAEARQREGEPAYLVPSPEVEGPLAHLGSHQVVPAQQGHPVGGRGVALVAGNRGAGGDIPARARISNIKSGMERKTRETWKRHSVQEKRHGRNAGGHAYDAHAQLTHHAVMALPWLEAINTICCSIFDDNIRASASFSTSFCCGRFGIGYTAGGRGTSSSEDNAEEGNAEKGVHELGNIVFYLCI